MACRGTQRFCQEAGMSYALETKHYDKPNLTKRALTYIMSEVLSCCWITFESIFVLVTIVYHQSNPCWMLCFMLYTCHPCKKLLTPVKTSCSLHDSILVC
jgi:hypothetical protein